MNHVTLITTTTLMSTMVSGHHYQHLMHRLNDVYHFDHHIVLMNPSTDFDHWFPMSFSSSTSKLDNLIQQSVYTSDQLNTQTLQNVQSGKNTFVVVIIDGSTLEKSPLLNHVRSIRNVATVKIGVFFERNIASMDVVEKLFRWSWSAKIVDILGAFQLSVAGDDDEPSFNVFKYEPFGAFALINVTNDDSVWDYFPTKIPNYLNNELRALRIEGMNDSNVEIRFWEVIASVFNAQLLSIDTTSHSNKSIIAMTADVMLSELHVVETPKTMYPHRQSRLVMLVPHAQPYSGFVAYLRNGTWMLFFVYSFIAIVASSLLLIVSRYLQRNEFFIFGSVNDVLNLVINDNANIRYRNLRCADVFVIVPLTFAGVIVMNGILSAFQSYLSVPIYQSQIDTMDDLYTSVVPIIVNENTTEGFLKVIEDYSKHSGWPDKLHEMHTDQLLSEIRIFNESIAFPMLDNVARTVLNAQKRLNLLAYHQLTDTFLANYPISFDVDPAFPFASHLNDIVHRLNGAGLFDKWIEDSTELELLGKLERRIGVSDQSDTDELSIFTVLWCGWIVSSIVLIIELMWSKIINRSIRRRNDLKTKSALSKPCYWVKGTYKKEVGFY